MDPNSISANEFNVAESAFWHTNMDLYYGFQPGEVVEVEHESCKYWLATIEYSFKHMILLRWLGNYGEFWVDTSMQNSLTGSNSSPCEFGTPKRLFQLGYHLQSQLKSQFTLEKPSKFLEKPSLYNPAFDPYAGIKTVDDLLKHRVEAGTNDTFDEQSSGSRGEPPSLVMAKCKTQIAYGQEDVDELEAALQNLNDIDSNQPGGRNESPEILNLIENQVKTETTLSDTDKELKHPIDTLEDQSKLSATAPDVSDVSNDVSNPKQPVPNEPDCPQNGSVPRYEGRIDAKLDDEPCVKICKSLQESAINKGRYFGIDENYDKGFFLKPKQLLDIGGANQEKVLVPGTLLEVCHTIENESGLMIFHWFATILKNIGGRLTLRWFLCDEPKFKQGRLEPKSCRSEFIREEDDGDCLDEGRDGERSECKLASKVKMEAKKIIFSMHYCNPCIHSISHAKSNQRTYKMPIKISSLINESKTADEVVLIEQSQIDQIFDYRRMNLDKDRPIIDHLLSTIRWMRPEYIRILFAPRDLESHREILLSTPKTSKLFRGFIKREIETGVFEIHSEPIPESGDVIKFIYPYDSSYSVLPIEWASNNQDCLSVDPSRNPTPTPTEKSTSSENVQEKPTSPDSIGSPWVDFDTGPPKLLCEIPKAKFGVDESDWKYWPKTNDFDELDPAWISRLMRVWELRRNQFHCSMDCTPMKDILFKFKVMDQLEVIHPSSDITVCLGRIRKIAYPLLWIQISADSYTLLPYDSTDIYPSGWCEANKHPLISLLPPRKRLNTSKQPDKKKKRVKICDEDDIIDNEVEDRRAMYEVEHFNLNALTDKQLDIDYILNEKSMYIRIYFNHKCFTGPSLSKGKICSLPQYVGPGPLRLVIEEVVTKVISVAYVPPRILNDLSSKSFEDLLIARNLTNTTPMRFKAKYQKRVHREDIPVCMSPEDVALYCECVCEHLKCCYNLFGPNLYDGDDCPGHCRALTKSNKFMKRATYYREKARLGEFVSDNANKKPTNNSSNNSQAGAKTTSRARYAGRNSSESTSSSVSRSDQLHSRASSADIATNEMKENLVSVKELDNENEEMKNDCISSNRDALDIVESDMISDSGVGGEIEHEPEMEKMILHSIEQEQNSPNFTSVRDPTSQCTREYEFHLSETQPASPLNWTVTDVVEQLEWNHLSRFKSHIVSEDIDGQALLLLDRAAINEHFQQNQKLTEFTLEEMGKLCRFIEFLKDHYEIVTDI